MFKVRVLNLAVDPESREPLMILKRMDQDEHLPIPVSRWEAISLAMALRNKSEADTFIYDVFLDFIKRMAYEILRVEITETDVKKRVLDAKIYFSSEAEDSFKTVIRASDALVLALRFSIPVYMSAFVWEQWKGDDEELSFSEAFDTSEEGVKWSTLLESMDPSRFGHA